MHIEDLLDNLFIAALLGDVQQGDIGKPVAHNTKVYRVEMPNGRGPYNSGLGKDDEIYLRLSNKKHGWDCVHLAADNTEQCGVTDKAFEEAHGKAVYGCSSLRAMSSWFPKGARAWLRDTWGAKIVVYEIKKGDYMFVVGHGEVVFNNDKAEKVGTLDLVTYEGIN